LRNKVDEWFTHEKLLLNIEQLGGSIVGFLNFSLSVRNQIAVWRKLKQVLVALALCLYRMAGDS